MNLSLLSKYRTELMGVATLLIVICHAPLYSVQLSPILLKFIAFGNVGVDIFLFLSGIGCFYSLEKGGRAVLGKWYKKRFFRIFIPYALMQVPYWAYYVLIGDFNLLDSIYDFSTLAYWIRHTGMWYIALLVPLYLSAPFIFDFLNSRHRYVRCIAMSIFLLVICAIPVGADDVLHNIISNIQWAFVRVVSFIIGLTIARDVQMNRKVPACVICVFPIVLFVVLKLIGLNHYWAMFPIIIYISILLMKSSTIRHCLSFLGLISLEMYLANGYIRYMFIDSPIFTSSARLFYGHYLDYFIIFILSISLSYLIKFISDKIYKRISNNSISPIRN